MVLDSSDVGFRKRVASKSERKWPRKDSFGREGKQRSPNAEAVAKSNIERCNFFEDDQVQKTGSIFEHRKDMQFVKSALPACRLNGFHIKMEDDCPQGGDDVRLSVLRVLGSFNRRSVPCVLCAQKLTVYDRYPLLDGTFFLSPIQHSKASIPMKFDSKCAYLHALCIGCMHAKWACARCGRSDWFLGACLVVGTLYMYDVLSTSLCCPPICRTCLSPILMTDCQRSSIEKVVFFFSGQFQPVHRADTVLGVWPSGLPPHTKNEQLQAS
uniref:Headcase middle domain-containing protein n=1 Tax=Parascaris univalens TaxID=6257 RepID=A0A914ZXL0_PARUN